MGDKICQLIRAAAQSVGPFAKNQDVFMAKYEWKTADKGIRYREHESRKHGIRPDRYYTLRYYVDGKRIEESLGWSSEGWTLDKARAELIRLKEASKLGLQEVTLREKRKKAARERKEQEILESKKALTEISFSSFWEEYYLPYAKQSKSIKSVKTEEGFYRNWINKAIGQTPLKDLSITALQILMQKLNGSGKSPRTVEYCFAVISQVWNYASNFQLVSGKNPVKLIKQPKFDNKRIRFLTKDEAKALLDTLKKNTPEVHDMAVLSLFGGLRLGEIMALRWADISFEHKTITILDPKSKKNRHCFINQQILSVLQERFQGQNKDELVFPTKEGTQKSFLSKSFAKTVNQLKLNENITDQRQKIVFHSLRHTFASWLVQNGTPIYTVAELMGHSTFEMTQRYAHLAPDILQSAASSLDGVF